MYLYGWHITVAISPPPPPSTWASLHTIVHKRVDFVRSYVLRLIVFLCDDHLVTLVFLCDDHLVTLHHITFRMCKLFFDKPAALCT